ncbi:SMP-30/gluconolactonase/LRE family protein [Rhizosaccharibacter radicis]|uniref:SMP-30/gluconolactonase/LRE family protein n=1 Tax=Rhizosaccharibacter radicis TaxID=2782605 RepID=A0ABT1VUG4_9PROT|nr:SMP-30/gluconolactonase/LRE family protein [Acetobacteraceae bacterium KSS12]
MTTPDIRCVLAARSLNGERPCWDADRRRLFWIDVREPALHCFDPATGEDRHWEMPSWIGPYGLTDDGAFVALRTGLHRLRFADGALDFVAPPPFDPRRFIFNEGDCDRQGRFWAGPMFVPLKPEGADGKGPEALPFWRWDGGATRDSWRPGTIPVKTANSLAWSADGTRMFHSDTDRKQLWVARYDPDRGTASDPALFADLSDEEGGPDGVAVDADGFLWIALYGGGKLLRLDPDGRTERTIPMPVQYPTMPAFGGDDLRTLFVTSACWSIPEAERDGRPLEGNLFALDAPVAGIPSVRMRVPSG